MKKIIFPIITVFDIKNAEKIIKNMEKELKNKIKL